MDRRVMEAVEDYLKKWAHVKVDIEVLESLLKPENLEVSERYVPSTQREEAAICSCSLTHHRSRNSSWQAEDDGWRVMEKWFTARECGQNEWHDIEYQGAMAKDPPCPGRTLKKPLPQQSSSSAREEGHWVLMEDRRR